MSDTHNDELLEAFYEEGLDMGLTEEKADQFAWDKFNSLSWLDWNIS